MFGSKKAAKKTICSLIGAGTRIEGNVRFQGGLRVDGIVMGDVTSDPGEPNMLVISEQARVEGEVRVGHLVLNGVIKGQVCASELLELQPKAQIDGDVFYKALEMHPGAIVRGVLSNQEKAQEKAQDRGQDKVEAVRPALKLASNHR